MIQYYHSLSLFLVRRDLRSMITRYWRKQNWKEKDDYLCKIHPLFNNTVVREHHLFIDQFNAILFSIIVLWFDWWSDSNTNFGVYSSASTGVSYLIHNCYWWHLYMIINYMITGKRLSSLRIILTMTHIALKLINNRVCRIEVIFINHSNKNRITWLLYASQRIKYSFSMFD